MVPNGRASHGRFWTLTSAASWSIVRVPKGRASWARVKVTKVRDLWDDIRGHANRPCRLRSGPRDPH